MIGPTWGAVRVMVATKPVDFRKGAEGLAALVRETMRADPFSGAVYVFRAKRADRVKLIYWDGTGVCLFAKAARGWQVSLAERAGCSAAVVGCGAGGFLCWKGWIGGAFTQRGRYLHRYSRDDCGTVRSARRETPC